MANIQKRGKDSYLVTVYAGKQSDGKKYIRRTKTVKARTKKELDSECAKFQQEVEAGQYIAPEKMTFGAFVGEWREKYGKKHLEAKTMETYSHLLSNHILPIFQNYRLDQVKPVAFQHPVFDLFTG
jgi:integrase